MKKLSTTEERRKGGGYFRQRPVNFLNHPPRGGAPLCSLPDSQNHPEIGHLDFWGSLTGQPTNVPEPASLSLLGAGLLGAGVLRRRCNRNAA